MKHRNDWHLLKKEDVFRELNTDMYAGLSEKEARRRRKKYGINNIWRVKRVSALEAVCQSVFDVATLLLIISAAAAALFDKSGEALAVTAILVIGGILRAMVFVRASRILEDMAEALIPVTSVIRGGQVKLLPASEIVPGDIVFLESGCTVPCDGRVVSGEDSVVSERGITENTSHVHKFDVVIDTEAEGGEVPCEYRSNMLFAGSTVLSGALRIAATSCGSHSLIGMKHGGIIIEPSDKLPLIEKLKGWCKFTSLVMLAFVMLLTVLALFLRTGFNLPDIFLGSMAMAVAAMSEYLTIIGYIIIAATVLRCARRGCAVHRPSEMENIAGVGRVVFCGSSFFESGEAEIYAYRANGEYHAHGSEMQPDSALGDMLSMAIPASGAGKPGTSIAAAPSAAEHFSERAQAVVTAAKIYSRSVGSKKVFTDCAVLDHVDSINVFAAGLDTSLITYDTEILAVSCGNISEVLRACTKHLTADGEHQLDVETRRQIFTECASLEYIGAKIVAVARTHSEYTTLSRLAAITQGMTFIGFFAIAEKPEKNAAENIAFLRGSGIIPIILSSAPEHDLYYCHDIGLTSKKTKIIPYDELDANTLSKLDEYGMIVSFPGMPAGATASAKVEAMQRIMDCGADVITAAVGGDISDAGVMKRANISFAVSKSEYRAVPEQLSRDATAVITSAKSGHGGFGGVIKSICAAHQAVRNIKSAAFYLTSAQIARLLVILAALLLGTPLLDVTSILIWGLLFDFAAVLVMAFEGGDEASKAPINRSELNKSGKFVPISILKSTICGVSWGASAILLLILTRLIAPLIGQPFTDAQAVSQLGGSLILTGLVISCEIMKHGSLFKNVKINYAFFFFAIAALALAPLIMLTPLCGSPCGVCSSFALIPPIVTLITWEIIKRVRRRGRRAF